MCIDVDIVFFFSRQFNETRSGVIFGLRRASVSVVVLFSFVVLCVKTRRDREGSPARVRVNPCERTLPLADG